MKGTFFQKPLEFRLDVHGESWNQGNTIAGSLAVKNHGGEPIPCEQLRVVLAHAELKKVRAKSAEAFEILSSTTGQMDARLDPQKDYSLAWSFKTDRNSPITDHLSSLFLLYGRGESLGQLQLTMNPDPVIEDLVQILVIGFRFVVKSRKASKGAVEIKLAPPDAKAFASLEQLVLKLRFEGETLLIEYNFGVKKVEATASALDLKKSKKSFEQSFTPLQYRMPSGRFNHDAVEAEIRKVMAEVEGKVLF